MGRFQTHHSNRDIALPNGSKDEPLWIAVQDFLSPLLQPHVVLWLASVSLKLKPLFVNVHHTLTWDQNMIRIELSVLRDLEIFFPHQLV